MNLGKNIIKYRTKNNLSQEQLAHALNISRQSISKWETGENLPSIDNLISLSGLLDISLDELVTGEPYLHFPYDYGRPRRKWPIIILVVAMISGLFFGSALGKFYYVILAVLLVYIFLVQFFPFDFSRYYTYWTLDKKGISYLADNQEIYGSLDQLIFPIKALLHIRPTKFIKYKQIKKIEIKIKLYKNNPNTFGGGRMYTPKQSPRLQEEFYFMVTTVDDETVYLNLVRYYWKNSSERQMLSTIIQFLKRKHIEFVDKQGISEIVMDRNAVLTDELYKRRDQERKMDQHK